jgi:hypothetical protein
VGLDEQTEYESFSIQLADQSFSGHSEMTPDSSSPAMAADAQMNRRISLFSRLYTPAAFDLWWIRISVRLRRYSVILSAAWADGVYLTAWPRLAASLSIFAALTGCALGAAHWSPYVIGDGSVASTGPIIVFAQSLPFLFVAVILGALSAHLGIMLTIGYVVGDYLIAGPAAVTWGYNSAWPMFVGQRLPLFLCYWLLYILAARTTIMATTLAASALRSVRGTDAPAKILRVGTTAIFQILIVYAWTLAAPMIFRVLWIWTGRGSSPITVPYYQHITTPWLPLAAGASVIGRGILMQRSLSRPQIARRLRRLLYLSRYADAEPAFSRRMPLWPRVIVAAAALTFLISGLLLSFEYAAAMFLAFAAILLARAVVLPKFTIWTAWARIAARVPLAARLAAGTVLVFLISRFVVAVPGSLSGQGKFGLNLICIAIGLPVMLLLAGEGDAIGKTTRIVSRGGPSNANKIVRQATGPVLVLFWLLNPNTAYASCVDDACCLATFAIAALLAAALICLAIFFLFPLFDLMLFPIAEDLAIEAAEEAVVEEEEAALTQQQAHELMQGLREQGLWEPIRELIGTGADSALENALDLPEEPPPGISREALEAYERIAQSAVDRGADTVGTQAARLQLIDTALKLWFY